MWGLIGVVVGFVLLIILILLRVDFGKSILVASVVLLLFSQPSLVAVDWVVEISMERETLELLTVLGQIVFLGFLYKDSGQVMRLVEEFKALVPDRRLVIAFIPAVFGLMPMPGGAYVSAPMIDDEADSLDLNGEEKTFMNWWWRHIWFWIYPLDMGLILASSISGVNIYHIAVFNLPVFIVYVALGVFLGLKNIQVKPTKKIKVKPVSLVYGLLPIITVLSLNILFGLPLYLSLFLGIVLLLIQNLKEYSKKDISQVLKGGLSIDLLLAAYGIMLFKGIIGRTESLQPLIVTLEGQIPILIIILLSSYGIGVLFGHLFSAVGVCFPVLLPLLPVVNVRTVSLMYVFVLLGYLTSPIHLCIILTVDYFGIDLKSFYRRILKPVTLLTLAILIYFALNGTFPLFF